METLKIESFDTKPRNVHLRSLYKEAEEFDINSLLRKCITLSSLHNLLLGQERFVPSWVALDGDTSDPSFWIETLTEVSTRSNEYICDKTASFYDLLGARSQALCASHAVTQLRKNREHSGHTGVNQATNINGKRPRADTNGSPSGGPGSASASPKTSEKPRLTLKMWMDICDGNRIGWRDIYAQWNQMIRISKAAKTISWENLEGGWGHQGLALSLGYFTDVTTKLANKCGSLISALSNVQPSCNNAPRRSYIPIVRGLDNLWPDAKNTEFECCIRDVVYGNFKPQATEQLLGYILDLARTIKGSTITVHRKSREDELKRAEALSRRKARQYEDEQREKVMKQREESCRQAEEDFGRDRLALDDERASIDMASSKLKEAQEIYNERERTLAAKEASYSEREGALKAKEASCSEREEALKAKEISFEGRVYVLAGKEESCIERGARTKKAELELQEKLEAYETNQRLLLEGQRRLKKDEEGHARNKAGMAKRDTSNNAREKDLREREGRVELRDKNITSLQAWVEKKLNSAIDRERSCATKEGDLSTKEEALCKGQAAVANERQELEAQKSVLRQGQVLHQKTNEALTAREEAIHKEKEAVASDKKAVEIQKLGFNQDLALHREREEALKADRENLAKEREAVARDRQGIEAQILGFKQDLALHREGKKALKADSESIAKERSALLMEQEEMVADRKAFEQEKLALKADQAALSRKQKEDAIAGKTLQDNILALREGQTALSREKDEVTAAREILEREMLKLGAKKALYDEEKRAWRERVRNNMQQMQEMAKSLSVL